MKYDIYKRINEKEEEDVAFEVNGLWFKFMVEDNAGSVTINVFDSEIGEEVLRVKMAFYGSYGNEKGIGCLYSNLDDNVYKDKVEFDSYEEGGKVLETKLVKVLG